MVLVAVSVCLATIVLNLHYRSPHHQSPSSLWHFSLAGSRALTGCRPGWGTSSYRGCRGSSWWESPSRSSRAALEREEVNIWGRRTRRLQVVCLFVCFPSAKSDTPELTEEPPPSADANGFNSEKNGYKVRIFLSSHSTDQNKHCREAATSSMGSSRCIWTQYLTASRSSSRARMKDKKPENCLSSSRRPSTTSSS